MDNHNEVVNATADAGVADASRRSLLSMTGTGIAALSVGAVATAPAFAQSRLKHGDKWDKTFPQERQGRPPEGHFQEPLRHHAGG